VKVFFSPRYDVTLPGHVWPTSKYRLIAERLAVGPYAAACQILDPPEASWEDLALVHTSEYLEKLRSGVLSDDEIATLELPWQPEFASAFRIMAGGSCAAAAAALDDGKAAHLGGGLHHAFANHGEGFCPINDIAVAIRLAQRSTRVRSRQSARPVRRAAVIDLDVHHGNGTAFIFESDPRVFTFSMHQQHNYPLWKPRGSRDIGLPDGAHDAAFLGALDAALPEVVAHAPACVFYLAGADPYEDDQLGGLRLTKEGLRRRDRVVIDAVRHAGVPLIIVLAGGYARRVDDTVAIHAATIEEARRAASADRRKCARLSERNAQ
jgi:acetoin utilization deacetylase AcuC-like enzyme